MRSEKPFALLRRVIVACMLVGGGTAGAAEAPPPPGSSYALPHNFYGAHLLVSDGAAGTRGERHLLWARNLVGRWGHAKTLLMGIDAKTTGPARDWVDYVNRCYELELIPFLRLAGHMRDNRWVKPDADGPGDYHSIAQAMQRVVAGLPRSDLCPLYIEVWNEPNLAVEWSGEPDAAEYAAFFVQAAKAIHEIGDQRIRVLNGGLATSPEWAEKLCQADKGFARAFDVWSCHPYPMNRPPSVNLHDKTAPPDSKLTIDSYLLELDVLRKFDRGDAKVMITETGYDLGNSSYTRGEGHPIIDEYNRADYIVRAFRDYWPKWEEIVAVFPFEFCSEGWQRFDWVYPDSGTHPDGSPTQPHYQYLCVAALAKPTDATGAVNGAATAAELGARLEGVKVLTSGQNFTSDPMGNYFLQKLRPGAYTIRFEKPGFKAIEREVQVQAGKNAVINVELAATVRAKLFGTVRSGDDDRALEGVEVRLEPGGFTATTERSGRFMFEDLIPARYGLIAEANDALRYRADGIDVRIGKPNRHDFRLGRDESPAGENLANNVSMESGGGGGGKTGIALGFEPLEPGEFSETWAEVSDDQAHTGRRSQKLRIRPDETAVRQITHYNTAKPGTTYAAGAWIRVDCRDRDGGAWISFDATDNGGGVIHHTESEKLTGRSREWVWVSLEAAAPERSERLSLNLHTKGNAGVAFFDDVYLGTTEK